MALQIHNKGYMDASEFWTLDYVESMLLLKESGYFSCIFLMT